MPDVITVLRRSGILIPETMIRAAALEGVDLAVAATILIKESGGGRNVYGHDPVPTGGTYVKGGPVTRENYLAYRAWMRAGSGRRQGVGPCQCTSAQYQDTADALGGCWDPLANMRSGFRGMAALIRQYGVQQGARRYNGSGPAAEVYGRDFLARYRLWQSWLGDASQAPRTTPPAPGRRILTEDASMYVTTAAAPNSTKKDQPFQRISYGFDPTGGWGGKCVVKLHFGFPGGWIHEAKWWVRPGTGVGQPNKPHSPVPAALPGGPERFGGMGVELTPPVGADELEILCSAPGGVHVFAVYER